MNGKQSTWQFFIFAPYYEAGMINRIALLLLLALGCSSCYTYHIYPDVTKHTTAGNNKETACVLNPELRKEYKILLAAGIFNVVSDSTAALKIKLYPLERRLSCGQGGIATLITIGQLPVFYPDIYSYSFELITEQGGIKQQNFQLRIDQRVWFWDMFVFNKKFEQKAGKVLLSDYLQGMNK